MKKILVILASDRFGGPARQVVQLAERLDRQRFAIIFACTLIGQVQPEFFVEVGKRGLPLLTLPQRWSFDPQPLWTAFRHVRREKIDIIQTHGYKACVLGLALKLLTGRPWLHFMHGHTSENRKVELYFRLEFKLARLADRIVCVSEEMRRRLVGLGLPEEKSGAIHNAIDPGQFQPGAALVRREQFGISHTDRLIGIIGRLSPEKGPDIFLEAFRLMAEERDDLRAMFIGEGPLEAELRERVSRYGLEERVIVAGYQPHIADFYPLLDLLVLPSRSEGLPNVALEALYFGVPVAATRVGGTPEVVVDGQTGLLVPAENPEALAEAATRLLDDRALRASVQHSGKEFIRDRYSPQARAERFAALYAEIA